MLYTVLCQAVEALKPYHMTAKSISATPGLLPRIESRIVVFRGLRVMIDADLATLYGVTTKRLNEQVKRNANRFPGDFLCRSMQPRRPRWSQIATTSRS